MRLVYSDRQSLTNPRERSRTGNDSGGLGLGGHEFSIDFSVAASAVPQASQLPKQFSLVTSSLDLVSSNTKGGTLKFSCNAGADLEILGQSTQGATFTVPMCITTVGKQQLTLTIVLAYSNGREPALPDMPLPISYKQKLDLTLSSVAYTYAGSTYNLNMSAGVIGANCPNCPAVSLSPASSLSNPIQLNSGDLQQIVYIIPSNGTQLSYALTSTSMGGVNGQSWFSVAPASDFGLTGSSTAGRRGACDHYRGQEQPRAKRPLYGFRYRVHTRFRWRSVSADDIRRV